MLSGPGVGRIVVGESELCDVKGRAGSWRSRRAAARGSERGEDGVAG